MVSASKAKRDAKKQASGKTSKLSSKAASKNASGNASDVEELDAHGNVIQKDEPATGDDKMDAVNKLKAQVDDLGKSSHSKSVGVTLRTAFVPPFTPPLPPTSPPSFSASTRSQSSS
jgi:hypothetical protein